jgi:hypothetical protein
MKELDALVKQIEDSGANVLQVSYVNRITAEQGQLTGLTSGPIAPGDYFTAEVRVVVPIKG